MPEPGDRHEGVLPSLTTPETVPEAWQHAAASGDRARWWELSIVGMQPGGTERYSVPSFKLESGRWLDLD